MCVGQQVSPLCTPPSVSKKFPSRSVSSQSSCCRLTSYLICVSQGVLALHCIDLRQGSTFEPKHFMDRSCQDGCHEDMQCREVNCSELFCIVQRLVFHLFVAMMKLPTPQISCDVVALHLSSVLTVVWKVQTACGHAIVNRRCPRTALALVG